MALELRAVYENGHLRLLDPVDLPDGQAVKISLETMTERDVLKAVLGDMVRWADPDCDIYPEAEAEARLMSTRIGKRG